MPSSRTTAVPVVSDGIVSLRPATTEDVPDITTGCRDPHVVRWTNVPTPYSPTDAEAFVASCQPTGPLAQAPEITWAITVLPEDRWCGSITLRRDQAAGADIGYLLAPWARGAGHAVRALRLACGWGFSALGLEVVLWSAFEGNDASLRAAREAGFSIPGHVFPRYGIQRGQRRNAWVGTMTPDDLAAAVRSAEARRNYLGPDLTRRERDVLRHLARGEANRAIAGELGISENTVKNHVRGILEKLQSSSRSEAVVKALRLGIVELPPT